MGDDSTIGRISLTGILIVLEASMITGRALDRVTRSFSRGLNKRDEKKN